MWQWLKNFFKSLFGSSMTQELIVKAAVSEQLRGKPDTALKLEAIMGAMIGMIDAGSIITLYSMDDVLAVQMKQHNMTPGEKLLMGVLISRVKESLYKNPLPAATPVEEAKSFRTLFGWIKETAGAYAPVKS